MKVVVCSNGEGVNFVCVVLMFFFDDWIKVVDVFGFLYVWFSDFCGWVVIMLVDYCGK